MADTIGRLARPDVRVFQEFEAQAPTLLRPLLQAAVIAQAFQIETQLPVGSYVGDAISDPIAYPGLLAGAEVDDFSAYPGESNLIDEVIVEIQDANGTFDVSNDDETVITAAGVTLAKALTLHLTELSGTVVTTEAGSDELTFPSTVDLHDLGVRIGDKLVFATVVADLVDPAISIPSTEVDSASGLPIQFDIIAIPSSRKVRVARLGLDWSGFVGEGNVQAEIWRLPAGTGTVIPQHEDGAGIDLAATATLAISNAGISFLDDPIQPGDEVLWISNQLDIIGVAATIITPTWFPLTTLPGGEDSSDGILGVDIPILAGSVFTDTDGTDFDTEGVTDDGSYFLEFITENVDLVGPSGQIVVRNVGRFQILGVAGESITLGRPLISEAPLSGKTFQYKVVRMNQPVAVANNKKPFVVKQNLGAQSLLLDRAMSVEARVAPREFEFKIIRKGVPNGPVLMSYRALRTDLNNDLLEVGADADGGFLDLANQLGVVSVKNPLALMATAACGNTTGAVACVGVAHWTEEGLGAALEVLGASDVYSIVAGTQESALLQLVQSHVNDYSDPNNFSGLERCTYQSMRYPFQDTRIEEQTASANDLTVDAEPDKLTLGVSATVDFSEVRPNDIIDFDPEGTGRTVAFNVNAQIVQRSSMEIVSNLGPDAIRLLEEVDASEGGTVVGPWKILTHVYSKDEVGRNVAATSAAIGDRRVVNMFPADVKMLVAGVTETVPTYYYAAAVAGKCSSVKPNKPLTFEPIAGFSGTYGGQGLFSENQFSVMAGGGTWVLIQESNNAPVVSRHQLTTDASTVSKREDSLRRGADFAAKFFRLGFRALIGRFNLTDKFITQEARPRAESLLAQLIADEIFETSASIIEFGRHPQKPDGLRIVIRAPQPKPNNYDDIVLLLS